MRKTSSGLTVNKIEFLTNLFISLHFLKSTGMTAVLWVFASSQSKLSHGQWVPHLSILQKVNSLSRRPKGFGLNSSTLVLQKLKPWLGYYSQSEILLLFLFPNQWQILLASIRSYCEVLRYEVLKPLGTIAPSKVFPLKLIEQGAIGDLKLFLIKELNQSYIFHFCYSPPASVFQGYIEIRFLLFIYF